VQLLLPFMNEQQKKSLPLERIKRMSDCSEVMKHSNIASLQLLHRGATVSSKKGSAKKSPAAKKASKAKQPTQTIDYIIKECHYLATSFQDKKTGKSATAKSRR
jgi:hypothetical protein